MSTTCDSPYGGRDCIRASFQPAEFGDWGGFYFLTGAAGKGGEAKAPNWGESPDPGIDLSGARTLSFLARGESGGERVEFFALGVGRDHRSGRKKSPYPGSSAKVSTDVVELSDRWTEYRIDLANQDLSNVLGGFAWAAASAANNGRAITFYVDDIRYDRARLAEPRFLVSYPGSGVPALRNAAYLYDNAMALLAFAAFGDVERASLLADAIVAAQARDRFFKDGRLRNAYRAGSLGAPSDQRKEVRDIRPAPLPGWFDQDAQEWREDKFQVSSHVGNIAWSMIALLTAFEITKDLEYLEAAKRMGNWVERCCHDDRGDGGYTAGFEGWEPDPNPLSYKSTEHNIDLFVAYQRLSQITGTARWKELAAHAKGFVLAMWDKAEGKFWTGTSGDGETIFRSVVALDVQTWAVLGLRLRRPYWRALTYAENHHRVADGFDFNRDRDGVWYEGSAQMAAAYAATGAAKKWRGLVAYLQSRQNPASGALPAASLDGLSTGLAAAGNGGDLWLYFNHPHVAATAWLALAEIGVNPFWISEAAP